MRQSLINDSKDHIGPGNIIILQGPTDYNNIDINKSFEKY